MVVGIVVVEVECHGHGSLVLFAGLLESLGLLLGAEVVLHLIDLGLCHACHEGEDLEYEHQDQQDGEDHANADAGHLPCG